MIGLVDGLKIGAGATAGIALVWTWFTLVTVPAAERAAYDVGFQACRVEADLAAAEERVRQQNANRRALEEAHRTTRDMAQRNDDLNEQLLDLAHAITADGDAGRACLGAERVRDLDDIR